MNKIKTLLASVAMMGLVVGNGAAAATRSYEALPNAGLELASVARASAPLASASFLNNEDDDDDDGAVVLIILGLLIAGGIILVASGGGDDDDDSPG